MSDRLHCDALTPGRLRVRTITLSVAVFFAAAQALSASRHRQGP